MVRGGWASVPPPPAFSKSFTELSAFCRCSDSFVRQCVHSAVDCFSSVMLALHPARQRRPRRLVSSNDIHIRSSRSTLKGLNHHLVIAVVHAIRRWVWGERG